MHKQFRFFVILFDNNLDINLFLNSYLRTLPAVVIASEKPELKINQKKRICKEAR